MARYSYVAKDMTGEIYKGIIQAADKNEVRRRLKQRDFYATSVKAMREWRSLRILKRVTRSEVAVFAEQLAVMVEAGLSLPKCIDTVLQQTQNQELVRIMGEVKQDLENGVRFSDALGKFPKVFPDIMVSMVVAGETSGTMAKSLRQIADYLDNEQVTRQKVKSALTYPKIVAFVSALAILVILIFIVPRFAEIYTSLGVELPLSTRILIGLGDFMVSFWWTLVLGVAVIYFTYKRLDATTAGREFLDKIKLYLPVFGALNRKVLVSRFMTVFSTLTSSGVTVVPSLQVTERVLNNTVMDRVIDGIRTSVSSGGGIRGPIEASDLFPAMVVQMVGVGEETGKLGDLLEKGAEYLDREVEATVKSLIARVEPTLTIIVAGIVALIALSIYMPLFSVFEALK